VKKYFIPLLAIGALVFASCSTELDINGNKKDVMVVYGILDASSQYQYIKINRAFLGEGNALEYAQIPDSTLYPYLLDVKLDVLNASGNSVLTSPLDVDTVNIWKDGGVFFSGLQPYYRIKMRDYSVNYSGDTTWLNPNYTYKLTISDPVTGNIYESEAPGLGNLSITTPSSWVANVTFDQDQTSSIKFSSISNGKLYDGKITIHYYEIYDSNPGDTIEKTIVWELGSIKSSTIDGDEDLNINYSNWTFFDMLAANIEVRDDVTRYMGYVDFYVTVGAEDLSTYIDVNQPSNSIIQERPSFSNISNGIGLFSSKYTYSHKNIKINYETLVMLPTHSNTANLRFDETNPGLPSLYQ
jgi:hypothetical protein